jgi:KaiC/GvpD/RAD55 family RecA-like ATPase
MELPPLGVDEKMPILKRNRLSTGIADLDLIMEGGYPNPGNVLLLGPTGGEKEAFAFQFCAAADPKKENVLIVNADATPDAIAEKASGMGLDLGKDNVYFIDCYSETLGQKKELVPTDKCVYISGPGALNDISIALNDMLRKSAGKRLRVIFHSLSTLVLYNPKESMTKFLQIVEGRLKSSDATTLLLVEEGVHDKQLLSLLEHGMDELVTLRESGGKFELDVPSVGMPIPVRLGPSGITVV